MGGSDKCRWGRRYSVSIFGGDVVDVDLLEKKKVASLVEGGKGALHLEVGDHVPELAIETTKKREDVGTITDEVAVLGESCGHRLEAAAEVSDRGRPLLGGTEFDREQQGARFALSEELVLQEEPGGALIRVAQHR